VLAGENWSSSEPKSCCAASCQIRPGGVLDVGGGPGNYATWLAEDGYEVKLIDATPELVEQARAGEPPAFEAAVGDARDLAEPDESADAVLLLGPLYHLPARDNRMKALAEAHRVLRPGGLLAAAAISRYTIVIDLLRARQAEQGTLRTGRCTRRRPTAEVQDLHDRLLSSAPGTARRTSDRRFDRGPGPRGRRSRLGALQNRRTTRRYPRHARRSRPPPAGGSCSPSCGD
jgi:SAM-dependent methyltransferase